MTYKGVSCLQKCKLCLCINYSRGPELYTGFKITDKIYCWFCPYLFTFTHFVLPSTIRSGFPEEDKEI